MTSGTFIGGYYVARDRPFAKRKLEDAEVLVEIGAADPAGRGSSTGFFQTSPG